MIRTSSSQSRQSSSSQNTLPWLKLCTEWMACWLSYRATTSDTATQHTISGWRDRPPIKKHSKLLKDSRLASGLSTLVEDDSLHGPHWYAMNNIFIKGPLQHTCSVCTRWHVRCMLSPKHNHSVAPPHRQWMNEFTTHSLDPPTNETAAAAAVAQDA